MSKQVALTTVESKDLSSLEQVIERGQKTFLEVGKALLAIQEQKLYRQGYDTFADYCKDRWGFAKSQAYRLVESARVIENLSPIGDIPETESQARPLTSLPPDQQSNAWADAVDECRERGVPVTAAAVAEVVDRYRAQEEPYQEEEDEEEEDEDEEEEEPEEDFDCPGDCSQCVSQTCNTRGRFAAPEKKALVDFCSEMDAALFEAVGRHSPHDIIIRGWLEKILRELDT